MAKSKYKIRITKCYLVEVVDKDGYVQYYDDHGVDQVADEYCFGTKEDAKRVGADLMMLVEESEAEREVNAYAD